MHRTTGDNYGLDSSGNRIYKEAVPPTTIPADHMNTIQEEICNAVTASGQTLADSGASDLNNQLAEAISRSASYDATVFSQTTFNALWERTGANAYKILDDIDSIYFKAYTGGYNMSGTSSPLSDGDTWGVFSTNNATFIMCDGGNFFQMGDTPSYWEISTSNTVVYNMDVRGVGAVAAAIPASIHIDAAVTNCKLLFPKVSNRTHDSGVSFNIFYDENGSSTILAPTISNIENDGANSVYCIRGFLSVLGGMVADCPTGAALFGVLECSSVSTVSLINMDATTFIGFQEITSITGCKIDTVTTTGGNFTGFKTCKAVSGNTVQNIVSGGSMASFDACTGCTGNYVYNTESVITCVGFQYCVGMSGDVVETITCPGASGTFAFYHCEDLSGCQAKKIEYTGTSALYSVRGFSNCNQLSGCTADDINATGANGYAYGFHTCARLSACFANDVTAVTANQAYGYFTCTHMDGSCEATSIDDYDFYTCSNEPFKGDSDPATPYGFTEVLTNDSSLNSAGNTYSYTPDKDCFLFGYCNKNSGTAYLQIRIGSSSKDCDQIARVDGTGSLTINQYGRGHFCIPCKGGVTAYFYAQTANIDQFTLRYMPFGTTT